MACSSVHVNNQLFCLFHFLTLFLCLLQAAPVTEQTSISPPRLLFTPHLSVSSRLIALHLPFHLSLVCLHFSPCHDSLPQSLAHLFISHFAPPVCVETLAISWTEQRSCTLLPPAAFSSRAHCKRNKRSERRASPEACVLLGPRVFERVETHSY